jgi:hypothetical protein
VVFLQFLSIGVVAWGITESNRNSEQQAKRLEKLTIANGNLSRDNRDLLAKIEAGQDLIKDCSSPGGQCFEDQIRASSVGAALGSISSSVMVMLECALIRPIELRTPAFLAECRKKGEMFQATVVQQAKKANEETPKR